MNFNIYNNNKNNKNNNQEEKEINGDMSNNLHRITINFYLVRHGETQANVDRIVLGQSDSPLTERGREQVKSLGKRLRSVSSFWRIYSSDLGRARETTRILVDVWRCDGQQQPKQHQKKTTELEVNDGDSCCYLDVTERIYWDSRLREIGKGAREGYSKDLTEQEVMEERKYKGEATSIPMEESLDEAWDRCHAWWRQVLLEASDVATSFDYEQNVLVIAHSAILRVFLRRLLGDEQLALHPHARFDERSGQLSIPNASLTVLQVPVPFSDRIKVHLQTLADAEHILNGECG